MKIPGKKEIRKPPQSLVLPELTSKKAFDDFLEVIGGLENAPRKLRFQLEAKALSLQHQGDISERRRLRLSSYQIQDLVSVGVMPMYHGFISY